MVAWTDFLGKDPLDGYEDAKKYQSEYLPKVQAYREKLQKALTKEYLVDLPDTVENLEKSQCDAVALLHEKKYLSDDETAITETPATGIVKKIASGEWTAVEVFQAFAKRSVIAHQLTNCSLEVFNDEGLARARELDAYFQKNGKTVGPLHGLPVSLKEQIAYKGKVTHGSYVSLIDNVADKSGLTVDILSELGAIFYVRTNQPQSIMHLCGNNNIIGWSRCPLNLALTSGGSSSGEGSLVTFGGSALGVGSDIGGSIRSPAAFSGCYGLRPTTQRISKAGGVSSAAGQESVPGVQGPLARSVEDIDLFMDVYLNGGKPWERDCTVLPMGWRKVESPKADKLTVGIIYDNGIVRPTPPVARALREVAEKLAGAGVKVVEHKPLETELAWETVKKMYACDGNWKQRQLLSGSGEPLCKLTKWALNYGDGAREYHIHENRDLNIVRDSLKQKYLEWMEENKVDVIISPTHENVAPRPETAYNWSYTALFNLIDFPTLVVQTGLRQDPEKDHWTQEYPYEPRTSFEELCLQEYQPDQFRGAPIGLQVTGRRFRDEEVVAASKTIVDVLKVDLFKA